MKIKIFQELYSLVVLESKINKWLEANLNKRILSGEIVGTAGEWYAVLWYKEE